MDTVKIFLLLGLLFLPACGLRTYYPETNPPSKSREGIHKELPQDIFKVQAKKKASQELCDSDGCIAVSLASPQGTKNVSVSNCNDYWAYRQKGWETDREHYTNDNYNNDYAFIESCNILKFVEKAKPSRYSHFMMPLLKGYYVQVLDYDFVNFLPLSMPDKNMWTAFNCGKKKCRTKDETIELKNGGLIHVHDNRRTSYFPAGHGDIDGDGWEDLLLNYYSYAVSSAGPDRISGHFCLSWHGEDKDVKSFDCVNDNFLEHLKRVQ